MTENRRSGKLAVILHTDIVGSTALVKQDEHLAHKSLLRCIVYSGRTIHSSKILLESV
jgi:hypothetical protein